jgi:hypothetical protein
MIEVDHHILGMPNNLRDEYAEYDPVEEKPGFLYALSIGQTQTETAWCAPYHEPTAEEIASGKYVLRRYKPLKSKWLRWLFGDGEFEPRLTRPTD